MNDLTRPQFVEGRNKSRFDDVPETSAPPAVTDRDVIEAIAADADLIGRTEWGDVYLLVSVPAPVFERLVALDAPIEGLEPDNDAEGNERGCGTEDDEPEADDEPNGDMEDDGCPDQPDFTSLPCGSCSSGEIRRVRAWVKRRRAAVRKQAKLKVAPPHG